MIALNILETGLFPGERTLTIKQSPTQTILVNEVVDGAEFYEFESFWYVALQAFEKKTGKELYDYIDHENFKTKEGEYPQFELTWQGEEPESMRKICPQLYDKFKDGYNGW